MDRSRVAVISDIHANCIALDAVLADMKQAHIGQVVCLGDAIQGGPQPAETVARLRELKCPVVMGNADYFMLTGKAKDTPTEKQIAVRKWSFNRLSKPDLDFISSFQSTVEYSLGERTLFCFHGSPSSFDDIIFPETPDDQVQSWFTGFKNCILTGGHTHLQQIRRFGDSFFFNPGSIGLANGSLHAKEKSPLDSWAEYAVLTAEDGNIGLEFRRVPFVLEDLIRVYRSSKRPFAEEMIEQYRRP